MLVDTCFTVLKQVPHLKWLLRQLNMVAPTFFLPTGLCLVAESPRWLIASCRLEAAERVMRRAAKLNCYHNDCVAILL